MRNPRILAQNTSKETTNLWNEINRQREDLNRDNLNPDSLAQPINIKDKTMVWQILKEKLRTSDASLDDSNGR